MDPLSGTWVVFSPQRRLRPQFFEYSEPESPDPAYCPFCEGNEALTPPEIVAVRPKGGAANERGWTIRVVPNKFPALKVEGDMVRSADGFYDRMSGIGAHEVVIETPLHPRDIGDMEIEEIRQIFLTYKTRLLDLKRDIRLEYIQVFKNRGFRAGATIPHAHSQIIALPIIPPLVETKLRMARDHFHRKGRCLICDIVHHDRQDRRRVLLENSDFLVTSAYAPRHPFELRLFPLHHTARFEETGDTLFTPLAKILKETVIRFKRILDTPPYHWLLVNCPFHREGGSYFHWYLELVPLVSGTGGFELGTGNYINPIYPEESIDILKGEMDFK